MGHPKNSTVSRRNNISRTATHKCEGAPDDRTPEEAKGNGNISESIEGAPVWTDDDESVENTQQDAWSISSNSSSIAVLDREEENDIHPSDSRHFSTPALSWVLQRDGTDPPRTWPLPKRSNLEGAMRHFSQKVSAWADHVLLPTNTL